MKSHNLYLIVLFGLCLCSCGNEPVEYKQYTATFDDSKIGNVEKFVRSYAEMNNLKVLEKDKEQLKYLSNDANEFFMTLNYQGDPIVAVLNIGQTNILRILALDYGDLELEKLDVITNEIKNALANELNLKFIHTN